METEYIDYKLSVWNLTDQDGDKYKDGRIALEVDYDGPDGVDADVLYIEDSDGAILFEGVTDHSKEGIPMGLWEEVDSLKNKFLDELEGNGDVWQQNGFASESDFWAWKEG